MAQQEIDSKRDMPLNALHAAGKGSLQKCMGNGPGLILDVRPDGYSYEGAAGSAINMKGKPPEIYTIAFEAFQKFSPSPDLQAHCTNLRSRSAEIVENAKRLSVEAKKLAESTTLAGTCQYLR
jgi:hypothetical protein